MNKSRLDRIVEKMKEKGLPQIIVADEQSFLYLLGVSIMPLERVCAFLIKDNGEMHIFANKILLFKPIDGIELHVHDDGDPVYEEIASYLTPGIVGFDRLWAGFHIIGILNARKDIQPVVATIVDEVRAVKDTEEIEKLRFAGKLDDEAINYGISLLKEGLNEKEFSDKICDFFVEKGNPRNPWGIQCVSFGATGADPHHLPETDVVLKPGDAVILNIFNEVNGYWRDSTRTVFYKEVSDHHRELYEIVKKAQQAGVDYAKPGVRMCDIDRAARQVIEDAGYGDKFIYRVGHGAGMTVHEEPNCQQGNETIAEPGMVFSIEPGIYIEGDIGIRIEDLVVITEDGCETLTKNSKELQIVGI